MRVDKRKQVVKYLLGDYLTAAIVWFLLNVYRYHLYNKNNIYRKGNMRKKWIQ